MMIKRDNYIAKVRPFIGLDIVKVLTGMRRSGKSVLMDQIRDAIRQEIDPTAQFVSINLELEENQRFLSKGVLHDYVLNHVNTGHGKKTYVFLDEISDVEEWEKCVNSLRAHKDLDIYITGSNSKLLSGELATYLTGRYVEIKVAPFSFAEFCLANPTLSRDAAFEAYLKFGGLPFLSLLALNERPCIDYLNDLYSSILLKDIVRRHKIRDADLLTRIMNYVMSETGHTFSAASIQRYLKHENRPVSFETVMNYLSFGEEAFLFSAVKREDLIGKRILDVDAKYYAMDHGMRRAVVGGSAKRDIDRTLEAIVYRELVRRDYAVTIGRVKEKEVDFVCQRANERLYVQVAYLMATEETQEREFSALRAVPDQYSKLVLSMDRLDLSEGGIVHRYLPDFLMEESDARN